MRAYVIDKPGGPDVLKLSDVPSPKPRDGWVHIEVKALGLNRAELITRAGGSGDAVKFPRIIGIECVGRVLDSGGTDLHVGQRVAAVMGGMGRDFDGSYAEQTLVKRSNVFPIETQLSWHRFAAIPETYLTAAGCMRRCNILSGEHRVLVRPGASALGIAIAQMTRALGGQTIGTTRDHRKVDAMKRRGYDRVIVGEADLADEVIRIFPDGPTAIIDCIVSDATIDDDLEMIADDGVICFAGSLAESYETAMSTKTREILMARKATYYSSETLHADKHSPILQDIIKKVENGVYDAAPVLTVSFDELASTHQRMEANEFAGKVIALT